MVFDSILNTIKQNYIGYPSEYSHFDGNIILLINSQFSILNQLGVGPEQPFKITGPEETWEDFFKGKPYLDSVVELIGIKVKLGFDPPQNGSLLDAMKQRADELEWRLKVFDDKPYTDSDA